MDKRHSSAWRGAGLGRLRKRPLEFGFPDLAVARLYKLVSAVAF